MSEIGTITARLEADAGQFAAGMDRAMGSLSGLQSAVANASTSTNTFYKGLAEGTEYSGGAERGIRRMEFALGGLAASSLGANRELGMLGEGALLFGGGSEVTLAVLAGLAAIGAAMEELGRHAKNLGDEFKATLTAFKMEGPLGEAKARIAEIGAELGDWQTTLAQLTGPESGRTFMQSVMELIPGHDTEAKRHAQEMIDILRRQLDDAQKLYDDALKRMDRSDENAADRRWHRFMESTVGDRGKLGFQSFDPRGTFGNLFEPAGPDGFQLPAPGRLGGSVTLPAFGAPAPSPLPTFPGGAGALPNWDTSVFGNLHVPDLTLPAKKAGDDFGRIFEDQMIDAGARATKRLADGIIQGKAEMRSVGRSLAEAVTEGFVSAGAHLLRDALLSGVNPTNLARTAAMQSIVREVADVAKAGGYSFLP